MLEVDGDSKLISASEIRHALKDSQTSSGGIYAGDIYVKLRTSTAPPLYLIDLPGLDQETMDDTLIGEYGARNDAILLVIIPASQTPKIASSLAFRVAKKIDSEGMRTVGVISKIDMATGKSRELAASRSLLLGQGPTAVSKIPFVALSGLSVLNSVQYGGGGSVSPHETAWLTESETLKSLLRGAPASNLGRVALVDALGKQIRSRIRIRMINLLTGAIAGGAVSTSEETKVAEALQLKEQLEIEKQENDILRREIEELKQVENHLRGEIEEVKMEKEQLKRQRDKIFNQFKEENEKRLSLEKQISDVLKEVEELRRQRKDTPSGSFNSGFSLQELKKATKSFSASLKVGEGGFGSVYKGSLRGTKVAIKKLHSKSLQGKSQFQQEVTVLTKVRHPNLVTLMGACPEASALVYEYLSNGSLEDRLTCAHNTPPLTWQVRTRIIGEICLALIFLHSNKPQLVVHGDLKPGNILLDANLVSKLSDFGVSHVLKQPNADITAFYQTDNPVGTLVYTDPIFLATGILTPKCDIYSFGIIVLQLLTGKPPLNIVGQVKDAMRDGTFQADKSAGAWPLEEAKKLANIGVRCADFDRTKRPNLVTNVWSMVEPLMRAASEFSSYGVDVEEQVPNSSVQYTRKS